MKKLPYLLNAAMVLLLVLGISSCASTPDADEEQVEIPDASEDSSAEADWAAEEDADADSDPWGYPGSEDDAGDGYAGSDSWGDSGSEGDAWDAYAGSDSWGDSGSEGVAEAEAPPPFDPDSMTLDELKDEAERLRAELIQSGLDQTMPDKWAEAESAFDRGTEAYNQSRDEYAQAIRDYRGMRPQPPEASGLSAEGGTLPANWRVGAWEDTGDCFWTIAENPIVYGNPLQWRMLYDANREALPQPNNPDLILPDMILEIPSISGEQREGTYNPYTGSVE